MRQAETWGMGTPGAIPSTVHHSSRSWSELFMLEGGGVFLTWNKLQNTLGKSECVRAPKTLPDAPQAAEALGAGPAAVAYPDSLVSERALDKDRTLLPFAKVIAGQKPTVLLLCSLLTRSWLKPCSLGTEE